MTREPLRIFAYADGCAYDSPATEILSLDILTYREQGDDPASYAGAVERFNKLRTAEVRHASGLTVSQAELDAIKPGLYFEPGYVGTTEQFGSLPYSDLTRIDGYRVSCEWDSYRDEFWVYELDCGNTNEVVAVFLSMEEAEAFAHAKDWPPME